MIKLQQKSQLTFIRQTKSWPNPKATYRCICGNEKDLFISNVKRGHTRSCGCMYKPENRAKKHGLKHHPLYGVWCAIKSRCYNKKNKCYNIYGGIGVRMCIEWKDNFISFYTWATNNGWKEGLQIDKDKIGTGFLYSPKMCSIVTNKENSNYRKNNRRIKYKGVTRTLKQWSDHFNIAITKFRYRLSQCNWDISVYLDRWS